MYSLGVRLVAVCLLACGTAQAGGLVVTSSPRSIGRAGTATVGDDGGGALLANPAAIARRAGKRGEVGIVFVDDELDWQSATAGAPSVHYQALERRSSRRRVRLRPRILAGPRLVPSK